MTSKPMCQTRGCMREAACLGAYEGAAEKTYACNGCCGHGNEDGHCEPVDTIQEREQRSEIASLREQVRTLSAANETLRETVRKREAAEIEAAAEADELREQVRTLAAERDEARREAEAQSAMVEAWSDALGLEKFDGYDKAEEVREERDALRARVAELESERDVERAMRLERETLLAGAREREEIAQAAVAQAVRERDTARDAALEEAAQTFNRRAEQLRREAAATAGEKLRLERSEMAEEAETEARRIRALKAQPARRFVEAEKAEAERRDAWIHGIETAAGIVAERGDDVQAASVVYDVLKARVEFERSHGTEVKP